MLMPKQQAWLENMATEQQRARRRYAVPIDLSMAVTEENSADQEVEMLMPKQQAWLENMATEEQLS